MSDELFVENFISECVEADINSPKEICNKALKRLQEIADELKGHNVLRAEYKNLQKVLRHFGHESVKRKRKRRTPTLNPNLTTSDLDPAFIEQMAHICEFIDSSDDPVTPRNIMDSVADVEDHTEVYVAIKWLCEKGILDRTSDRSLIKGERWEDRPHMMEEDESDESDEEQEETGT